MKTPFHYALNDDLIERLVLSPQYRINESGEIFTLRDRGGHIKATWRRCDHLARSGYYRVSYRGVELSAHRIVYRKFHGPLFPHLHINHIDGNKGNNRLANIELVTPSENQAHAYRVLKNKPRSGRSKITDAIANEIRQLATNGIQRNQLAIKFKLCKSSISYIVNGKTWRKSA